MKKSINKILLGLVLIVFTSCVNDTEKKVSKPKIMSKQASLSASNKNLNISFLLDLSDRIDPIKYPNESMEYYLRDVAYIKSVSDAFDTHLRRKKIRGMNDKIQLYFDPEPRNQNINTISKGLKYNINRSNVTLELLDKLKESYALKPKEIYDLAIIDNNYVGSDTWRFFKTKVNDYCVEENYRNILVVLTDGYIYHENTKIKEGNLTTYLTPKVIRGFKLNNKDWKNKLVEEQFGFIPATDDLSNLEILVLGLNPDNKNPYEQEVIVKYWKDWFEAMKVKRYDVKTAELPSNMDKIIKDFILNN
ncbi:hypothetical protein [uncultured Lacinutrix sp.]|uniref:hypothetical protein n=1 Tax=uncultured Lacinutrix sp. TaxID=574032 RepID=UPI002628891C|nr:hypothetical protein [uncultured Lacinutrix sp.]